MCKRTLLALGIWFLTGLGTTTAGELPPQIAVRGGYASPKPFWDVGARLDEYGVNAVFVHSGSLSAELVARARAEGAKVYAEFPTLNGRGYVDRHPGAWPINERGEREPPATWFMGVCPTEPGFRAFRMRELEQLLERFEVDGVWMDYVHWHAQFEDPRPVLPETCFSPTCLAAFEAATGIRLPEGATADKARWILANHEKAWRDWRCRVLADWAIEMRGIIARKRPGILLGIYHAAWTDEEFGGGRRRILGLDFDLLAPLVDVFSPMVYHARMGRPASWVGDYIEWFSRRLGIERGRRPHLWPIVQAHGEPGKVSAAEFAQVMRGGASGQASGLMMFTLRSVAEDPEKMKVLRALYRGR